MATIRPFMAIRPAEAYAKDVAALPYDVMNSEEAREMVQGKPWSFLHVDKAEVDLPKDIDVYSPAVYAKAKENLENMIHNGILGQDLLPNLYLYRMTMNGRSQTGLVCCTSVDEYINGTIKKHELTRADKEADRKHRPDFPCLQGKQGRKGDYRRLDSGNKACLRFRCRGRHRAYGLGD